MKKSTADDLFSKCIRERAEWRCERCGTQYVEGIGAKGLECSHLYSRRHYGIRFDPLNAFSHCSGCHRFFTGEPVTFTRWAEDQLGLGAIEILIEKKRDIGLAKTVKKNLKDVTAHYRKEFKRMKDLRAEGVTGRIEFEGFI